MQNGYYQVTGAMVTQFNQLDITSNNLANVNTQGFKRDSVVIGDFERLYQKQRDELTHNNHTTKSAKFFNRTLNRVPSIVESVTDFSAGSVKRTDNKLDFALQERDLFYAVQTPDGVKLTQQSSFIVNSEGVLTTKDGYTVLPKDFQTTKDATISSGSQMITVAVRRVNITNPDEENLMDYFKDTNIQILPNSAGCFSAKEAISTFRLVREATGIDIIKLEVIGDAKKTLYPDVIETIEACKVLKKDGFTIMAYTSDDLIIAKKLEDAGADAVMPLAAPIGSGLGVQNRYNVQFIKEALSVPVIVDAGVGCASDASIAMELGADGVLTNTAIAGAKDPIKMAEAMRYAVISGRLSYQAGRILKKPYATASSPVDGLMNT
jgi:thiazole synthase